MTQQPRGMEYKRARADARPLVLHIDDETFTFPAVWPGSIWMDFLIRKDEATIDQVVTELHPGDDWTETSYPRRPWLYAAVFGDNFERIISLPDFTGPDLELISGRLLLVYSDMMTAEQFNEGFVPPIAEALKGGDAAPLEKAPASDG